MMIQNAIYIISAPSGTGKSSLIRALLKTKLIYATKLAISHTTRAKRYNEIHGQHYFFISIEEFEHMIVEEEFIEYAKVFNNYYGTSWAMIKNIMKTNIDIILDIDWQGAQQIRNKIPEVKSIFISPPSKEELNRRLHRRGQDNKKIIYLRQTQVINEMIHLNEYDYLIINDDFNTAFSNLKTIILAEQLRLKRQKSRYNTLINKFIIG